jgi:hypothetical protein
LATDRPPVVARFAALHWSRWFGLILRASMAWLQNMLASHAGARHR